MNHLGRSTPLSMESEVLERLKTFSLSRDETTGVDLEEADVKTRMEEGNRSLLGIVFGDKRANFLGLKTAFMMAP